jgi:chaperonin GroES
MTNNQINFHPMNGYVLIKRDITAAKTTSGIILPDAAKKALNTGKVVAFDQSPRGVENSLTKSDAVPYESIFNLKGITVTFPQYAGHDVEIDGDNYVLIKETELLGLSQGEHTT